MPNKSLIDSLIRRVPDFPKPGILFYDISTLLLDADGLRASIIELEKLASDFEFDKFAALESRGFVFGAALADRMNKGLILLRKKGKLPGKTRETTYGLEYGSAVLEISDVAISKPGERILIIDDLLATGGTAKAGCDLISELGGQVVGAVFLIEIQGLNGSAKIAHLPHSSLLKLA